MIMGPLNRPPRTLNGGAAVLMPRKENGWR